MTNWNSLDNQNVGGPDAWLVAEQTANALSELNSLVAGTPGSAIAVDAGQTAAVMTGLYDFQNDSEESRDLVFQFRAASAISGSPIGDYNDNGIVDAADFTAWRDLLGQSIALPNEDPDTTPGEVTSDDYMIWKTNFGNTGGGGGLGAFEVFTGEVEYVSFSPGSGALTVSSVPEPSAGLLAFALTCGLFGAGCRSRSVFS
jgi:hypothetical protein